jgi:hypothetical protein
MSVTTVFVLNIHAYILIYNIVAKLLKRFDVKDRSIRVSKLVEGEIRDYLNTKRNLNDTHLTKMEVKVKRILLAERGHMLNNDDNKDAYNVQDYVDNPVRSGYRHNINTSGNRRHARSPMRPEFSHNKPIDATNPLDDSKTHRNSTYSEDLVRGNQTINHIITNVENPSLSYIQPGMATAKKRGSKFNMLSPISQSGDEWTEIEKFNALAEAHDKRMNVINRHKSQQRLQDSLKQQIMEHREFKKRELMNEKIIEQKSMQMARQEQLKADKKKIELTRKMSDRKEMVDKQLSAHHMQKRLHNQEKIRYEKMMVGELKQKLALDKQQDINKKMERRKIHSKVREENEQLKLKMVEIKEKEKTRDKKYIEDYNKMIEKQEETRVKENEDRNQKVKARIQSMGKELKKDHGKIEKQQELILLNRVRENEHKEILSENKKTMELKRYQKDLRGYLALQVDNKRKMRDLEKQKNKWFVDQEYEQATKEKQEEINKQQGHKLKELENKKFVANQIGTYILIIII